MPNNLFLDPTWVAMKIMRPLKNSLEVASNFDPQYANEFQRDFAVGSTVQLPLPTRFLVTSGLAYQPQPLTNPFTTVSLDRIRNIHFDWNSYEKAVYMNRTEKQLEDRYFTPAGYQLAQQVDSEAGDFAAVYSNNVVGVLGTDGTDSSNFLDAEQRLFDKACPEMDRSLCISSSAMKTFSKSQLTSFNPTQSISSIWKKGYIGKEPSMGWEWYRSNSLRRHTAGTWAGAVTVTGAGQSGSSLIITGTAADTIKKGDKISIANVNAVNPSSRTVVGAASAMNFTVTDDYTLTGGADTINIYPAIAGPGDQYQNVDALPADGAALTLWPGTATPNGKTGTLSLGLTKAGFAMVAGKFPVPTGSVEWARQVTDPETGISLRILRQYLAAPMDVWVNRIDICFGFGVLRPDNGTVVIAGA
jgi:hypothetical protein